MQTHETGLASKLAYDGRIVKLTVDEVRLPNGLRAVREVVHHPGAVAILAIDDQLRVLLVRQYRYPVQAELWELPAGKLEEGEDPCQAAGRELAEETGFKAENWRLLYSMFTSPGFCNERLWLYQARRLTAQAAHTDWDENIVAQAFSRQEIQEMIASGAIADAKTLVGLLYFLSADVDA